MFPVDSEGGVVLYSKYCVMVSISEVKECPQSLSQKGLCSRIVAQHRSARLYGALSDICSPFSVTRSFLISVQDLQSLLIPVNLTSLPHFSRRTSRVSQ
jgi:hypothetical protein